MQIHETELIKAMAEKTGLSEKDTKATLEAFRAVVTETMAAGDEISMTGFGRFATKFHDAHTGLNPRTGEQMEISAKTTCYFKPGKLLTDAANKK